MRLRMHMHARPSLRGRRRARGTMAAAALAAGAAFSLATAQPPARTCGYENCTQYCGGACPFRPNISSGGTENLTVYRMTPYNVSGILQHDTGDARGDMGFLLTKHLRESTCHPPYITKECFLDDHTIVGAFNVTFDSNYGPYLKCNPNNFNNSIYLNMSDWICAYGYPDAPWVIKNGEGGCPPPCQRANVSVGKDPTMHRFWFPMWDLLWAFGGYWYDTPALGECARGRSPGDGSGCTWAVRGVPAYVNGTCLVGRLFAVVEKANPGCFSQCPQGTTPTDPCFAECLTITVRNGQVTTDALVAAWEAAFAAPGGCPRVRPVNPATWSLARP